MLTPNTIAMPTLVGRYAFAGSIQDMYVREMYVQVGCCA